MLGEDLQCNAVTHYKNVCCILERADGVLLCAQACTIRDLLSGKGSGGGQSGGWQGPGPCQSWAGSHSIPS